MEWDFDWGIVSDRGRVRSDNQDAVLFWCAPPADPAGRACRHCGTLTGDTRLIAAVADGMGGVAGGSEASRAVVAALLPAVAADDSTDIEAFLRELARQCHEAVLLESRRRGLPGMGSTLTMILLRDARIHLLHVGDSRCYRISPRPARLARWSRDQNLAAQLEERGIITAAEAERHPGQHILTGVLGGEEPPAPEIRSGDLAGGDEVLLVCSDGLIRVVAEDEIRALVSGACAAPDAQPTDTASAMQTLAERLLDLANERGSPDNVSIVAVRLRPRR